jgi:hypothetical protein
LLTAIIVVLLVLPTGCAMHSYAPTTTADTRKVELRVGDKVRVVTTRRERLFLRITEIRSDRFVGVNSGEYQEVHRDPFAPMASRPSPEDRRRAGETIEVPYDELAVIVVRRFDAGTAALVAVAAVVTVGASVAAISAIPAAGIPAK